MKKLIILSILLALAGQVWAAPCHIKLATGDYLLTATGDKVNMGLEDCAADTAVRMNAFIKLFLLGVFE